MRKRMLFTAAAGMLALMIQADIIAAQTRTTLDIYVVDVDRGCAHPRWRDPLFDEWCEVVEVPGPHARR